MHDWPTEYALKPIVHERVMHERIIAIAEKRAQECEIDSSGQREYKWGNYAMRITLRPLRRSNPSRIAGATRRCHRDQ